jgi:UPF0716 protein FxsA
MRFLLLAIVLAFPLLDLYATVRFARWTGVPAWVWLGMSIVTGFVLLQSERHTFRAKLMAAMHGEQSMLRGLVDSGRKQLAALLFLLPGIISDVLALTLLALPLNVGREPGPKAAGAGRSHPSRSTLDGEFRRVD